MLTVRSSYFRPCKYTQISSGGGEGKGRGGEREGREMEGEGTSLVQF